MGNAGTGSVWHLAAAMLEKEAGVKFTHIPYEGAGPAISALLSGFVDAVPVSPAEVKSYVEQGKLRTLASSEMGRRQPSREFRRWRKKPDCMWSSREHGAVWPYRKELPDRSEIRWPKLSLKEPGSLNLSVR